MSILFQIPIKAFSEVITVPILHKCQSREVLVFLRPEGCVHSLILNAEGKAMPGQVPIAPHSCSLMVSKWKNN